MLFLTACNTSANCGLHKKERRSSIRAAPSFYQVLVTPRMHGIHHSVVPQYTDSTWGTIFSWWDKLHQTYRADASQRADVAQYEITIGVPQWRDEKELRVIDLWKMQFGKQRS